jgi:Zn-dependent protease with chaperone function
MYEGELERARELMPVWLRWAESFTYPCLTFALVLLLADAGAWCFLRSLRASSQAHWTERARQLFRVRRWSLACCLAVALPAAWVMGVHPTRLAVLSRGEAFLACLLSVSLASALVLLPEYRRWNPRFRIPSWRSSLTVVVVLYAWIAVPALLVFLLPSGCSLIALACALALSVFAASLSLFGPFWFLSRIGLAHRLESRALGIEDQRLASQAWSIDLPTANAFAYPLAGQISVTERAREMFDASELAAILRHEAAHLTESKWVKAARASIVLLCQTYGYANLIRNHFGRGASSGLLLVTVAAICLLRRRQHREEIRADTAAIGPTSHAPAYARALEKLHEFNLLPAVWGRRTTHRDLYDRMLAAGVTPTWSKPERIPRIPPYAFGVLLAVAIAIFSAPEVIGDRASQHWMGPRENAVVLCVALDEPMYLTHLAVSERAAGRSEESIVFNRAAACIEPFDVASIANSSRTLSELNRCDEARADLAEAERRAALWPDPKVHERWLERARNALSECAADSGDRGTGK